jgi:hypothetical protein
VQGRRLWPVLFLLGFLLPACDEQPPASPPAQPHPDPEWGTRFDPATAGTIEGTVRWDGPIPQVAPFRSVADPLGDLISKAVDWPNPNAPRIDPDNRGVGSAVVFLRGIDPRQARPWHHPRARVEVRDWRLHVGQGAETDRHTGFVRAGERVELVSRQEGLCTIQARGAAFFALGLTQSGQSRSRPLPSPGVVELMSGSGQFWMRAYLFVAQHPYLAHPDSQGLFRLEGIPPGEYDLVAWHADWRVAEEERNPELFRIQHVRFRPPFEVVRRVRIQPGQVETCELNLSPP